MNSGKTDARHERRLRKTYGGLTGLGVVVSNASHYKNRMVTVSVGRTDFNDPMEALRRKIIKAAEAPEPSTVKILDARFVVAAKMDDIGGHPSRAHIRSAMKRVPRGFLRVWRVRYDGRGVAWFFMYPDKVIRVLFCQSTGWRNELVPVEGISPRSF